MFTFFIYNIKLTLRKHSALSSLYDQMYEQSESSPLESYS